MAGNTGAMIALVPSVETAQRLAVPQSGEPQEELHCTLVYLGEADALDLAARSRLLDAARHVAESSAVVAADGFAIDVFSPKTDDSCIVLGLGGNALEEIRDLLLAHAGPDVEAQRQPWIPHVTLIYTDDFSMIPTLVDRTGPVIFDRLRVVFADEAVDFSLGSGSQELVDVTVADILSVPLDGSAEIEPRAAGYDPLTAAVNAATWSKLPVADRDTKFAFRAATDRLAAHASSIEQFSSWFFWRDESKPANNRNSYRMPFADVFDDGTVKLVPAAVFSAAAQLSGAHGALPVIPEPQKKQIRDIIDRIYAKFRDLWDDPRQVPPWQRPEQQSAADEPVKASAGMEEEMSIMLHPGDEDEAMTAAVNGSGWSSYPVADTGREWDAGAARARIKAWAGDDMGKYRKAFLWFDAQNAENVTAYKFPIADIIDGKLTIIPHAVNAADSRLSGADIPAADKSRIQGILDRIQKRFRGGEEPVTAAGGLAPLRPPVAWYENPQLKRPTRIRVTDDGRVFGHVAAWKSCHVGYTDQCLQPPRSKTGYAQFATGTTMTAEGILLKTGNLVSGGEHAPHSFTASEAAAFYAATSAGKASVAIGEDAHGIWVAGALSAGVGEEGAQDLRQHPMSGDWRNLRGVGLEMIAALAVNVPGFPIPEYALTADGSEPLSLISAGVVDEEAIAAAETETQKIMQRVADLELRGNELKARVDRRRQGRILNIQLPVRGA